MTAFWKEHPALLWGMSMFLGCSLAVYFHWILVLIFLFLCFSCSNLIKISGVFLIFGMSYTFAFFSLPVDPLLDQRSEGIAYFSPKSLKIASSPFNKSYLYEGTIKIFETQDKKRASLLSCRIYHPLNKERPPANQDYLIEGTLCKKRGNYTLKPKHWYPVENTWRLAELRFLSKENVHEYLKKHFKHHKVSSFFHSLATGDIDERSLSLEFKRLGLQHILAISGFHFGLIAAFLGFFLRFFLPFRFTCAFLLFFLTIYFVFLGEAPSVERAWTAITVRLIGTLLNRTSSGLNALGISLIVVLFLDPLAIKHIGFQLSFLCTLAILLYFPLINSWVSVLLPKRSLTEVAGFSLLDQHGYLGSTLIRNAFSLTFAVSLFAVPATLFIFHQFPFSSLVYNLFFPFWVGIVFFLLLAGVLLHGLFPPFASWLHHVNDYLTNCLLTLSSSPPSFLDFSLIIKTLPFSFVSLYLAFLFYFGIWLKSRTEKIGN
jgi:competence protein ComEC